VQVLFTVVVAGLLALPALALAADVDLGVITVKQKAQADAVRQRLVKGESFESLAKELSVGPAANRGGRLGLVPDAKLRAEYRQALKDLKPGQPSLAIPTEEGYTILMRFDKTAPAQAPAAATAPQRPSAPAPTAPTARSSEAQDSPQLAARQMVLGGLEAWAQGNLKAAESDFSKALGLNPREDSAGFLLDITRQVQSGKFKPQAGAAFAEGFLAFLEPNMAGALTGFQKARQADPRFWPSLLFEANVAAAQGRRAEAKALLQQVLAINPQSARAHLTLGMLAMDERNVEEAGTQFKKALEAEPDMPEANYRLGNLALATGNLAEAETRHKAALAQDPFKEEAYNDLGLIFSVTGRFDDAVKAYKKALELDPAFVVAHVNLGVAYARMGKVNAAIDEFRMAIDLNPRLADAHANLAAAYIMKEQWDLAIEHTDLAVRLGAQVPEVIQRKVAPHRGK
jgi:tetratricopeptide (TPR) repeat protein